MKIMPVVSTKVISSQNVEKNNYRKNSSQVSFNGFKEIISKNMNNSFRNISEAGRLFDRLINEVNSASNRISSKHYMYLISQESFKQKLNYVKNVSENTSEVIVSSKGDPLVQLHYGKIRFNGEKPYSNRGEDYIEFSISDNQCEVESNYVLTRFHENGNRKQVKTYASDYSGSESVYYNEDGSENNFRNFMSDVFGL